MPRRKGSQNKFQYAEAPVFKYQTFDRDTRGSLAYHQNPIFPSRPILFSERFTNSGTQLEQPVVLNNSEPAALERKPTDEGGLSSL